MQPVWITDSVTSDLRRAVHYTLLWGLEGVVLRTVGGPGDRVPHVNEARLRERLAEAELPVVAVDPGLFEAAPVRRTVWLNDLAAFDETAAFCRRLGCPLVLSGALAEPAAAYDEAGAADVLRRAGGAAARSGLRLAVRNESGGPCASGEALAALISAARHPQTAGAGPAVGAAWSPADALESGHDPASGLAALRAAGADVLLVTVRDGVMDGGAWADRIPGEGALGWAAHLAALLAAGFDGPLALDGLPRLSGVRGEAPAKTGLHAATALIRLVRAARQNAR